MMPSGKFCALSTAKPTEDDPYWCTATGGNPGAYAEVGLDGQFFIKAADGSILATNPKKA